MRTKGDNTGTAVGWLLSSAEPAVRLLARRDLLGEKTVSTGEVLGGPMVRALLSHQGRNGGFGIHPYRKWTGPIGGWCPWSSWAPGRRAQSRAGGGHCAGLADRPGNIARDCDGRGWCRTG
jgi:hypothetical protein